jgi:hypothetical protein
LTFRKKIMKDILIIALILVGWFVLQRWALPAMGIPT